MIVTKSFVVSCTNMFFTTVYIVIVLNIYLLQRLYLLFLYVNTSFCRLWLRPHATPSRPLHYVIELVFSAITML